MVIVAAVAFARSIFRKGAGFAAAMVALFAVLYRWCVAPRLVAGARAQAEEGVAGRIEGHAAMHMAAPTGRGLLNRIQSPGGRTTIVDYFVAAVLWTGGISFGGAIVFLFFVKTGGPAMLRAMREPMPPATLHHAGHGGGDPR
jgi:hypothetical protein